MITVTNTKVIIVTGPSGAGRSCAIRAFEDSGFEAVDNPPLSVLKTIIQGMTSKYLVIGLDTRTRDFCPNTIVNILGLDQENLLNDSELDRPYILYLDCAEDVLVRRFSETRRRHPVISEDKTVVGGIRHEKTLLKSLYTYANVIIDTSTTTPHQLKHYIIQHFNSISPYNISISIVSFSYKQGLPISANLVFDCRFLKNPYWEQHLRQLNGTNREIQEYVRTDTQYDQFFSKVSSLCEFLIPQYTHEGKTHMSIAFGCTGGKHRSVATVIHLQEFLGQKGWNSSTYHRDLV